MSIAESEGFEAEAWDQQIEEDLRVGRLRSLIEEAEEDAEAQAPNQWEA